MMPRNASPFWLALVAAMAAGGCPIHVACGDSAPTVRCQSTTGTVQIAESDFDLPPTAPLSAANGCLTPEGTCTLPPRFAFQAGDRMTGYLSFSVELAPTAAPGMHPLSSDPAAPARVQGLVRDAGAYRSDLRVRSGSVNITRNDREALQASFEIELETLDGAHILSLTGQVNLTGCNNNTYSISTDC